MLEYKAILTDFAEFKKIPFELEEYEIRNPGNSTDDDQELLQECEISFEFKGRQIQISLIGQTPESMFRTWGPVAALEMSMSLGFVTAKDEIDQRIEQLKSDYPELFSMQGLGAIEIVFWDSEEGTTYLGLLLKSDRVSLVHNHIEVIDSYLLRLYTAGEQVLLSLFGVVEGWSVPGRYKYHSYVQEAAQLVDRVFLVSGDTYLESTLEPLDWNQPGVDSSSPESIPSEFVQSEFTERALWQGSELLDLNEIRANMFNAIAEKLSLDGSFYKDDEQMLWMLDHVLVTADSVIMSINSGLSLGSRGYFRVPENVKPFKL